MNNKKLVWLASYPKSGNTWVRIFLSNYFNNSNSPIDINNLDKSPIFSSRVIFDEYSPLFSSDLLPDEIDIIRYDVFQQIANELTELQYFKIHDSYHKIKNGKYIFPSENTFGAIYIIRNPLDVAVSYAYHSNISMQNSCEFLCNPNASFAKSINKMDKQIYQALNSWSEHVISWTKKANFPILLVKYEDLKNNPEYNFQNILEFLKIPINKTKLLQSIKFSSFDELKKQESEKGFKEKPVKAETFFRKGMSDNWKKELSESQVNLIIKSNFDIMKKYSYI